MSISHKIVMSANTEEKKNKKYLKKKSIKKIKIHKQFLKN